MNADHLFHLGPPHLHLLIATPSETEDLGESLRHTRGKPPALRILRGRKAHTAAALFDEFAAALQFPSYFGENWNALDECLADLEWLPGDAYLFFVTDSEQLLGRESPGQLADLLQILEKVSAEWSRPAHGSARPPRPFHVVFQCAKENESALMARLHGLGRTLDRLH